MSFLIPGSGIGFAVLEIVLGLALGFLFLYITWYKVRLVRQGQPEVEKRWDRPVDRIKYVLLNVLAQRDLLRRWYGGPMHVAIFWGFLILFLSIANFLWEGLGIGFEESIFETLRLDFLSRFVNENGFPFTYGYTWYHVLMNVFVMLVLIAMGMAFFRRLIWRPKAIELSGEALLILSLISLVMITDMMLEGSKIIGGSEAPGAFMGGIAAAAWRGIGVTEDSWEAAWAVSWWLHFFILFGFLNYLPLSKHMHIMTAPFNTFFKSQEPNGAIPPIPDLEERESWGAHVIPELTWKNLLDGLTCQECGRCEEKCPASITGKPLSPKKLMLDIKHTLVEEGLKTPDAERKSLISEALQSHEEIWACTTCHACMTECPVSNEHIPVIIYLRRYLTLMEGNIPTEGQTALQNLEKNSNPWGMGFDQRMEWADGLDLTTFADNPGVEYCYFVGCAGAFDDRYQRVARNMVKILRAANISFSVLGVEEGCCGDTSRRMGNEYLFKIMVEQNIETMKDYNIKKIITTCPHGYNCLKNEYPQFGGEYEVIHHTQLINDLIKSSRLKLTNPVEGGILTYHDSCYLGRHNHIYDEPREILKAIPGIKLKEMGRSYSRGFCCGGGGGRMWLEETIGERINVNRSREALEAGAEQMAVACPFCMSMFEDGVKLLEQEKDKLPAWKEDYPIWDITELVVKSAGL
jgi:Fe-S oxidoreductase